MTRGASALAATCAVLFVASLLGAVAAFGATAGGREEIDLVPCGGDRWPVKTLTDRLARSVDLKPVPTSVAALRRLRAGQVVPTTPRLRGAERRVFRVRARLVATRLQGDRDIHLVVADPQTGGTLITELPDTSCPTVTRSSAVSAMRSARARLLAACGPAGLEGYQALEGMATITGVGFWDPTHGNFDEAPNYLELHPVLSVTQIDCRRR